MRPDEWFALALRVIGAVVLLYGLGYLFDGALFRLNYFNYPETTPRYYAIAGFAYIIVATYLLRGAPQIVNFAYPPEVDDEEEADDSEA